MHWLSWVGEMFLSDQIEDCCGKIRVSVSRVIWGDRRLVYPRDILSCGQSKAYWSSREYHCGSPFCQTGDFSAALGFVAVFFFFHFKQIKNTQTMLLLTAQGSLEGGAV